MVYRYTDGRFISAAEGLAMAKKRPKRAGRSSVPPKKPPKPRAVKDSGGDPDHYEFVRAFVDADGSLRWEYKVRRLAVVGRMTHDEDVSGWTEADIVKLTRRMLDVDDADPVKVEVHYV